MSKESGWRIMQSARREGRDLSALQTSFDRLYVDPNGLGLHFQEDWWLLPEHRDGHPRVIDTYAGVESTLVVAATISVFDDPLLDVMKDIPDAEFYNQAHGVHIDDTVKGWMKRSTDGEVACLTITDGDGEMVVNKIAPVKTHRAISSYITETGMFVVHIIPGAYAIGTPFQGQTGLETRVTRPFDGPQKWTGKLFPKP